jgi:hypothetical protein
MRTSAYLVARLDVSKSPPVVAGLDVVSESWKTLTLPHNGDCCYVDIMDAIGENFDEARDNLMSALRLYRGHAWAVRWLESGSPRLPLPWGEHSS